MAKGKVLPFISKGKKTAPAGDGGTIIDHGSIGGLSYEVYDRGVIHIFDSKHVFKKGCGDFESSIEALNLEDMREGSRQVIPGSGDNDNLVFVCENGDITLKLEKRTFSTIEKLKGIISTAKTKIAG